MTSVPTADRSAAAAYDPLAEVYDDFTADHDHGLYFSILNDLARDHGFAGGPVLDIGCGTGSTLEPWLAAGHAGIGVDVSSTMLEVARRKLDAFPDVELHCADIRDAGDLPPAALALALSDTFNYLLDGEDLRAAFTCVRSALERDGLLIFDLNSRLTYETTFRSRSTVRRKDRHIVWSGRGWVDEAAGISEAELTALGRDDAGCWSEIGVAVHRQRHHTGGDVRNALADCGLVTVAVRGLRPDATLDPDFDESRHPKSLWVARRADLETALEPQHSQEVSHADQQEQAASDARVVHRQAGLTVVGGRPPHVTGRHPFRRPRIKPTVEVFEEQGGAIALIRARGDSYAVGVSDVERELLLGLDGSRTVAELQADLAESRPGGPPVGPAVEDSLGQLSELGIIEDLEAPERELVSVRTLERLDQQLQYFAEISDEHPAVAQATLRECRVVIIGAGGLGSWALLALAGCGLGRVDIHDGDVVELGNLNRQVIYTPADVGAPKAAAAGRWLRSFDPEIEVRDHPTMLSDPASVRRAVQGADLVVGAADWPLHRFSHWLDEACFAEGVPYVSCGVIAPFVRAGPLFKPGETGCLLCLEDHYRSADPHFDELVRHHRRGSGNTATTGPACALVGAMIGADATHLLTGIAPPVMLGRALTIDLRTLQPTAEIVPRRPTCARCCG
jgi:bacteriocin biosynthesis cyclodehydratase domain-containing protein